MKILYLINNFNIGGATEALIFFVLENRGNIKGKIISKNYLRDKIISDQYEVEIGNGEFVFEVFNKEKFDLIHWFKADSSELFEELCLEMKNRNRILPILTTVCQYPTEFKFRLTPNEIIYSQFVVHIDNPAYYFAENKFINPKRHKKIFLGVFNLIEQRDKKHSIKKEILFGRGSSLNKCHPKIVDWYSEIKIPYKRFIIAGIGSNCGWLEKKIHKYCLDHEIDLVPHLPYGEWLDLLSTFDVFLYQIPLNSYSSFDATMCTAMLYGIPVVFYGSEAPKQMIVHGESGFIANNKKEFVYYASLLANDTNLRFNMGQNARKRIMTELDWKDTLSNFIVLYKETANQQPTLARLDKRYVYSYNIAKLLAEIRFRFVNLLPKNFRKSLKRKIFDLITK